MFARNKYYHEAAEWLKNETNAFIELYITLEPAFSTDGRQTFSDSFVHKINPAVE